jgi:mannose-6-phosphate isomerase-like protein (cupin superfamily)
MAVGLTPIRRVVTGNDERGRSKVTWDGPAPNSHEGSMSPGRGHTDLWVWNECPVPLSGTTDDGNLKYVFAGPGEGGHCRVVQIRPKPADYDPAKDRDLVPAHPPKLRPGSRGTWDRGGNNSYSSSMHKTETVDYGIVLSGERGLILDDGELTMKPGDIVIQVGAWHQWVMPKGAMMAFSMIGARFVDGPQGLAQGNDQPLRATPKLPAGVKPVRRIVTIDRAPGKSSLVTDGPSPDVRTDPARPGYACARLWVTDSTPAKIVSETLHLPHVIVPPARGTVFNAITFPPDDGWKGKVGAGEVKAFFAAMGAPGVSAYSPLAPHPYMQKTGTLDFCIVMEGEIVLVLDTQEVRLKAGEIAFVRGNCHAWSNRSARPAVVAVASHDGKA